ncbi:MAG: sensor histidine kinase [Oscillospiraceae bacterium]
MIFLFCAENIITFLAMAVCGDQFCVSDAALNKKRFLFSAVAFSLLLPVMYLLKNADFQLATISFTLLITAQYITFLGILFRRVNLRLIYIISVVELITEHLSAGLQTLLSGTALSDFASLAARAALLLLMIVFYIKTDRARSAAAAQLIPKHIYVLFLLALFFMSGLVTLNSYQVSAEKALQKSCIINVLILILSILVAVILLSLMFNVISKQQSDATAKLLSEQVESQIRHYDRLEILDNEMRRFRHDYTNHLQSILSLIQMGEYSDAEDYIEQLQKQKPKVSSIFYTGNKLADAILSDRAFSLPENVRIEYEGVIPPGIENTDLCVLLSNALDNAAEACAKCSGSCVISVSAASKSGYLVLTMTNPTTNPAEFTDLPATTKQDKLRHGIGLVNIQQTVRKYDGQMKINCAGGVFELTILLKLDK